MRKDQRRKFLLASGALLAAPLTIAQQATRKIRIGVLQIGTEAALKSTDQAFLSGLRDRGYVSGQNLVADFRYSDGNGDRLRALAEELVALRPDVLVGTEITSFFLKAKTSTIPIVLLTSTDPVATGLVKSLSRPGTNVTGMSGQLTTLVAKQVEVLIELVPRMSRIALLTASVNLPKDNPYFGRPDPWVVAAEAAAKAKGLALVVVRAKDAESLREAFATLRRERCEGVVFAANAVIARLMRESVDGMRLLRVPSVSGTRGYADAGGLLGYGPLAVENYRYSAKFVDLIVRGANPADIPVEQVSRFELVVNQKAARELGINIPDTILLRADRVIE